MDAELFKKEFPKPEPFSLLSYLEPMIARLHILSDDTIAALAREETGGGGTYAKGELCIIFLRCALGWDTKVGDGGKARQWNEKHAYGLPGFRCGINPDGLLNVLLRNAKGAWSAAWKNRMAYAAKPA